MAQREVVAALRIEHKGSDVCDHVTLSFGVAAMVPCTNQSPKMLMEIADRALYQAKAQGRDCVVCAT